MMYAVGCVDIVSVSVFLDVYLVQPHMTIFEALVSHIPMVDGEESR